MDMRSNPEILRLLRCPNCGGELEFEDEPPRLKCNSCKTECEVRGGIPRFSGASYLASFGRQWNRYEVVREEEDASVFQVKTGFGLEELAGRLVLDAGCGGGRYTRIAARARAKVVGVDLSSAVEKAAGVCSSFPDAQIVQGDLLRPPITLEVFDYVFSIGVLHHCPDARSAFSQIAKRVKPGGKLAVWLYAKNTWPQEWFNNCLRAISTRTPPSLLEKASVALAVLGSIPLLNKTLNKVFNFSNHPDWTLRVCDNFDWYAPKHQSHHTIAELEEWFTAEGFSDLQVLPPARSGRIYDWAYRNRLIIGAGVNVVGTRKAN
jgi:SAM-dependent methyltransferase